VVPFGQVRKGWPLVSAGENGFTIELVGEIANMVRLSAGTESLENELYRSSVKVVAGPGCEPDDRIPTSREFLLSNPSARRAGQWNQAEFVINPVTPRPTSSERSLLDSLASFQESIFLSGRAQWRATYIFPRDLDAISFPQ
jgi:hypothetical protein